MSPPSIKGKKVEKFMFGIEKKVSPILNVTDGKESNDKMINKNREKTNLVSTLLIKLLVIVVF